MALGEESGMTSPLHTRRPAENGFSVRQRYLRLLLLVGLSTAPYGAAAQAARDSAGVRVVRYTRTARPLAMWTLGDRPLLETGASGDEGSQLATVRGVVRLSGGRIAVANGATHDIRVFDHDGRFVRALGREGAGPGEFKSLTRLMRAGDTLVGIDGDTRAHVFTVTGTLLRSLRPARRAGSRGARRVGLGTAGTSYVVVINGAPRAEEQQQTITYTVTRSNAEGDSLLPLLTFPGYRASPIAGTPAKLLLDAEGHSAASGDRFCVAYSDRYDIACYDGRGILTLRIGREVARREIREEERAIVRQAFLDANRDAPPAIRQRMVRAAQEFRFAERTPLFSRLLLSEEGDLWIGPFDPGFGLPGPGASLAPRTRQVWSVFARDGAWVADVTLPPRFVLFEAGRDYVAGVAIDDDDVESAVVWALRR